MFGWATILVGIASGSFWSVLLASEGRPETKLIALSGLSMTLLGLITFACLWHWSSRTAADAQAAGAADAKAINSDWLDVLDAASARREATGLGTAKAS